MALDPKAIQARKQQLKAQRGTFETHWQEVAERVLPSREFSTRSAPGAKRSTTKIYNTAPVLACQQLAASLHGMLVSPALRWVALRPLPGEANSPAARAWFEDATERMHGVFQSPGSGFTSASAEFLQDLVAFGSGIMFAPDRGRRGPGFQSVPLAECLYAENAEGRVDTLYRDYELPAREVLRLWPDTTPARLRAVAEKEPDKAIPITHAVEPDGRGGWDSCWCTEADYLEHGRFQEFPYIVARWSKRSGETYGTGPGMDALPDVKLLNELEKLNLRGLAKAIDPPIMVPNDGFLSPAPNFNPGAINYFRSDARHLDRVGGIDTGSKPQLAETKIEQLQQRVRDIFYTTWLNLPAQPNMTATEILQRRDEYLRLFSPITHRLINEFLAPVVERTWAIMWRNRMFAPIPQELQGRGWTVEYQSPLVRAQRAADAETVVRWMQGMQPLVAADPRVLQAVDTDEAARYLADRLGAPARIVRTPQQLAAIRQAAAQAEQQQAQVAMARQAAGTAKDGASALSTLAGIGGGQPA